MNIVLEGPDNSGKSMLAAIISHAFSMPILRSPGPPSSKADLDNRIEDCLSASRVVFDRHPCVSQQVYGKFRQGSFSVDQGYLELFYQSKMILIYCQRPKDRGMSGHRPKEHDTPEHLRMIEQKAALIEDEYLRWAVQHADIFYRWSMTRATVCALLSGVL